MINMNSIAIVVVTYNRLDLLKKCISKIQGQNNADLIIIDNNSDDGTSEYIKNLKDKKYMYFNTQKNLGGAGGFSYGIKKAYDFGYKYALVMDDDTMIENDTIDQLLNGINQIDDFSFLACKVLWKDGNPCLMNKPHVKKDILKYHNYLPYGYIEVDSSSFVGCLINMEYVKKIGLPISEFFIWGDDVEYTTRLSNYAPGFLISNATVIHECANNDSINISSETNIDRIKRYKFLYRNRFYNMKKRGIRGIVRYFLLMIRDFLLVILKAKYKLLKISIIMKGFILGLFFNPKIEMVDFNENKKRKNK